MPLDHYVSQVHLKNFNSPQRGEMLYAIRKPDMKAFPCRTRDVCRAEEGSTNNYLTEPRAIEEFLTTVEPRYNAALSALRAGRVDPDTVYVIAGFVAYVLSCSPAAMRINSGPLRGSLEATSAILDRRGDVPKAPPALGGKTMSELLADGTIEFNIDGKYPQAIGISNVLNHVNDLGSCHWDVLINDDNSSPFFTSDYPVAIEESAHPHILNRVVPLAPDVAIRICPGFDRARSNDFTFPGFSSKRRKASRDEVRNINRLIVRSAETLIFHRDQHEWVARFVERHKLYRVECAVRRLQTGTGEVVWSRLELREHKPA